MRNYVELVSPVAPAPGSPAAPEVDAQVIARLALAGARVSIVDNSKSNAREVLDAFRDLLIDSYGAAAGMTVTKPVSGPIGDEVLSELARGSDLVLVGSAD